MATHYIIIADKTGKYRKGAILEAQNAHKLRSEGAILLPVEKDLLNINGASGYVERSWGSGVELPPFLNKAVCPVVLYVVAEHPVISFAVSLQATDAALRNFKEKKVLPSGFIRLTTDNTQRGVSAGGLKTDGGSLFNFDQSFPAPDKDGCWHLQGTATLNLAGEGYYGFGLYGRSDGMKVQSFAVSQSKLPLPNRFQDRAIRIKHPGSSIAVYTPVVLSSYLSG